LEKAKDGILKEKDWADELEIFNPDIYFLEYIKEGTSEHDAQTLVLQEIVRTCNIMHDKLYSIFLSMWKIRTKKEALEKLKKEEKKCKSKSK
jgi:hypothetical protein